MKILQGILVMHMVGLVAAGCTPGPESSYGFRLPDGDPVMGQQVFLDMQCHACHRISNLELPALDLAAPVTVTLGGPTSRIQTYGQLVTSIINPSHKLISGYPKNEVSSAGESFMPAMNEFMTVRQLIDVVAFLQGQYQVVVPTPYPYTPYDYGQFSP